MGDRHAARLGDDLGEQRRLVEAPRPLPAPMQRHRHDGVGLGEELAAGIRHPAAHGGREVEPVAVFEGVHELARDVVVAHRRAGAPVGRRIGDRLHRQHAGAGIERERDAEPLAIGRRDERELRPAGRAQALAADRLAAGRAELRQRHVDGKPEGRAQARRQAGRSGPVERRWRGPRAWNERYRSCARASTFPGWRKRQNAVMSQSPIIFDRNLLRARRRRAAALGPATFLIDRVAEDFSDRLATVLRRFELAVDLGTPTDAVRRALRRERQGRQDHHHAADGTSRPTRRRCRSATARSISSSPRSRCSSSTICRAR